jgi:hypothetical protein
MSAGGIFPVAAVTRLTVLEDLISTCRLLCADNDADPATVCLGELLRMPAEPVDPQDEALYRRAMEFARWCGIVDGEAVGEAYRDKTLEQCHAEESDAPERLTRDAAYERGRERLARLAKLEKAMPVFLERTLAEDEFLEGLFVCGLAGVDIEAAKEELRVFLDARIAALNKPKKDAADQPGAA